MILKNILNSKTLAYLLELVLPTILSILFTVYLENKNSNSRTEIDDIGLISFSFIFLFFFSIIIEWYRRHRVKTNKIPFDKYIYILAMVLIFLIGVWYVNSIFD